MKNTTPRFSIVLLLLICLAGPAAIAQPLTPASSGEPGLTSHLSSAEDAAHDETLRNGNNVLGNTYNATKCGLNYVQVSKKITNRHVAGGPGAGLPATFSITGIPATCRTIEKAYVYIATSYFFGSPASPTLNVTNPLGTNFTYSAPNIGTAPEKCWTSLGEIDTRTFRADVTTSITGNGNYVLNTTMPVNDIDGMTLMIIYSDATANYQGTLVIDDGTKSTNMALATIPHTITGFTACANALLARAFVITGDFQLATHNTTLNGVLSAFPDLFYNFDENPTTIVTAGQTSSNFAVASTGALDCFSFVMAGLYYQTTTCTVCPSAFTVSVTPTQPTCGLNNGAATAVPTPATLGPYTYSWSPGGMNTATVTGLAPGTYTVTVTGNGGCNTATQTVTLNPSTPVSASVSPASTSICSGSSTTLTASGGGTYNWSTAANTAAITVAPAVTTTYTVTVTTAPCSATATSTVTVTPAPVATFSYTGSPYCQTAANPSPTFSGGGTAGTFSASSSGLVFVSTSTGEVNLSLSTAGTYTVTNTIPASGGCPAVSATATITITAPQTATFSYPGTPYCQNAANPSPVYSGGGVAGTFSSTAGLIFVSSATGQVNLSASTASTYTVTNTIPASGGCPSVSATATITINPVQSAAFSYSSSTFCSSATDPTPVISGTAGGTFSATPAGLSIDPSTGTIALSTSTLNTYAVTYTTAGPCAGSSTINITITDAPSADFTYSGPYCSSGADPSPAFIAGGTAGTFSAAPPGLVFVSTATGVVDLSASLAGTYTVTNDIPASGGCAAATANATITIEAAPVADFSYSGSPFCTTGTDPLPVLAPGASAGTFSSGPGLVFVNVSTGEIDLSLSTPGSYTVTNTLPASGACPATTATTNIVINAPPSATFSYTGSPYCQNASIDPLPAFSGGGIAGTFSSSAGLTFISTGTGQVDLSASTPNTYTVTNTIPASGGCAAVTATAPITILAPDDASFSYSSGTYCQTGTDPVPVITGLSGGTFSAFPSGLVFVSNTTGEIDLSASALNTYTITYTTSGPCENTSSVTVLITDAPDATFSYTGSPYCINGTNPLPVFPSGSSAGTFSATPGGLVFISTSTGEIDLTNSAAGPYTITNTLSAGGGCPASSATYNITINPPDDASFSYPGSSFCQTGTNPVASISGASGGTFSATPAGLSFVSTTTGEIDLAASAVNTYTILYTTSGPCENTSSVSISINPAPDPSFTYASPYCAGGANPFPTLASGATAGTFSASPSGLSFVSTSSGQVDLSASSTGTYTVTNTLAASGGCPASSATASITINPAPDASFSYSGSPYCQTGSDPAPVFSGTATAGTFSASSSGLVFVSTSTGEIDLSASAAGTYTITNTIAASGGCPAVTDNFSITINPLQNASFSYASSGFCQSGTDPSPVISGVSGGTFSASPAGLSINTSTGVIDLSASGLSTYTVTYTTPGPCANSSTVSVTISTNPTAAASGNSVCSGGTINLTSSGGTSYSWAGPLVYASSAQNPTITGASVSQSGTYTVTVSNGGCTDTAQVYINVTATPDVVTSDDTTVWAGTSAQLNAMATGSGLPNYSWSNASSLSCSNCPDPVASPLETTTYCVTTTNGSCSSSECVTVYVLYDCPVNTEMGIPNAFSPNEDGVNDLFTMQGWKYCMREFYIIIFDRWGEKVYETSDPSFEWNGTFRGKKLDSAVFVYMVKAVSVHGVPIKKQGNITLIR